jgi:hypothetical protein
VLSRVAEWSIIPAGSFRCAPAGTSGLTAAVEKDGALCLAISDT